MNIINRSDKNISVYERILVAGQLYGLYVIS